MLRLFCVSKRVVNRHAMPRPLPNGLFVREPRRRHVAAMACGAMPLAVESSVAGRRNENIVFHRFKLVLLAMEVVRRCHHYHLGGLERRQ